MKPLIRCAVLALLLLPCVPAAAAEELFPRPSGLEPDIAFWVRIYSEVGTDGGLIHDSRDLSIVYDVLRFPAKATARSREKRVEREKKRLKSVLRKLGQGRRSRLSIAEQRVLDLFPKGVANKTLARAAKQLRFQLGQADKFRAGIIRSGAWAAYIQQTFDEMGLPAELAALPHVESSYTASVYSRVGAAGLWQFTRSTGRRYMRVDHVADERLDPFQATIAAGRLLEANKLITGTWPLAITAYNHGASGMRRAVRKLGTSDIEQIMRRYKSRTFGFASRNFYIEFLAAAEVSKFAERYFGPLVLDEAIDYETHELPHFIRASALASATGVPIAALRAANPALSRLVWRGEKFVPRGYTLRVPRAELQRPLALALGELPADQRLAAQTPDSSHKVRRGDTLSGIAARYGTSARTIASLNKLRSRNRIYPGQLLRLPYNGRSAQRAAIVPTAPPADGRYRVRRGDSVSIIAKRFGLQPQQLASLNSLRDRNQIYPGQVLRLRADSPPPAASPPTSATVEPPPPARRAAAVAPPEAAPEPEAATPVAALPEPTEGSEPAEPSEGLPSAAEVATSVEADTSELERELLADPADYSVTDGRSLEVQPAETLGHIAEWLDVRASRLRELNNLRYGTPLAVHQRLTLDFGRVTPDEFVRRRLEHHRAVQAAFFERYEISGSRKHTVRRGDSVWVLAQRARVPIWLLQQYNPDLDFATLRSGTSITLPIVRRHGRSA